MGNEKRNKHEEQGKAQGKANGSKANLNSSPLASAGMSDEWAMRHPFGAEILRLKRLKDPEAVNQMSASEICKYLESGELSAKGINQDKLYQCIMIWESRGYTESMMAKILGKSPRTIRRYAKEIRELAVVNEKGDFKMQLLQTLTRRWNARTAYFIHLANDENVKPETRLQAMKAAQEVDRDLVNVMSKFMKS